jgi:replicative DNA helicase
MFHSHTDEAEYLFKYIQKNAKAPSKQALRQMFPEFVVYKVDDTSHWCDEVRTTHKQQSLIDLMDSAMDLVDAGDEDAAINMVQRGVVEVQAISDGVRNDFDAFDEWEQVYDDVSSRVDRVRLTGHAGIPTGFKTLDDITGGMQPSWFGVIAARLGEGKTWTGIRMGYHAATTGRKVTYFSLEQPRIQIAMRMHAFGSRQFGSEVFNPMDLNRGRNIDVRAYRKFLMDMKEKRGSGKFKINDTARGRVSLDTIAAVIEIDQPDLVIIDYLTLLSADTDDWRGTAKLSGGIQNLCHRYSVPIWALSQVNRLGIGKDAPGAEHLSQADAIGQDADIVMTQKQMSKTVMKHRIPKFRHGLSGNTWFSKFSPSTGEYEEVPPDDAEDLIEADQEED